jgi:hypothetical protein
MFLSQLQFHPELMGTSMPQAGYDTQRRTVASSLHINMKIEQPGSLQDSSKFKLHFNILLVRLRNHNRQVKQA